MEMAQLRALVMIAAEGSFTRAAERLHVSQPALSQQIKALEQDLGVSLFERRGRRITLTAAGEIALTRAEQALLQLEQLKQEVQEFLNLQRGQVRVGTSDTICLYLLPPFVHDFRIVNSGVDIHLTNRHSQEVVELLQAGAIDFGIVTLPVQGQGLETTYLCDRQDVAVCAPDHPLIQAMTVTHERTLSMAELTVHPLLLLERGTTSRAFLDQLFLHAGIQPQAMELGSIEVLKRYAEVKLGVAVVPEMAVQREVAEGKLVMFALPWLPVRAIGIVTRRDQYQSPAAKAFLTLLQDAFAN